MSITGVRPANVTGRQGARPGRPRVIMVDAARGRPGTCRAKGLMRLLIHVEDMAEVFTRILLADAPPPFTTRAGSR